MYVFDYPKRIRRFQDSLKAEGVGCAIVMVPANVRYLTGFWGYATRAEYFEPGRLLCVVVPQNGQPLLVVPKIERSFAQAATDGLDLQIEHHVEWSAPGERRDAWGIVREFIVKSGTQNEPVSVEQKHLTDRAYRALKEGLDGFRLVESSEAIERHRDVKDPVELKLHRACGHLAAQMFEVEFAAIKEGGYREFEVAMKGWAHNVKACAACIESETPNKHYVDSPIGMGAQLLTSGPRLARSHGTASTRMIERSDIVAIDLCRVPYLLGYRTGFGRVITQRPLTSTEEDINAVVKKAYDAAVSMCRPGVIASDVDVIVKETLTDAGLGPYIMHRCGRTLGSEALEVPIAEGNQRELEADMILSIEPSIYMDGFQSRIESTFRITHEKAELLTPIHEGVIRA
jgi:Xaa-Pro aminopeptidase